MSEPSDDYPVGYRKPPVSGRFRKGRSGNPRGRHPGRKRQLPFEEVLGQLVTILENGVAKRVTAEEAFLRKLQSQGLSGDAGAARALHAHFEATPGLSPVTDAVGRTSIEVTFPGPGNVDPALEPLRMAKILDRFRKAARVAIEPWLLEAALARSGEMRLSVDEQRIVFAATRTPHKVPWPDWWEVRE